MSSIKKVNLGDKEIYNFCRPYIIAEIGANHNGNIKLAKEMIKGAKKTGADSAKFQSWSKENLFSKTIYDKNKDLEKQLDDWSLSYNQLSELKKTCDKEKISFSCTPISNEDADFLVDDLDVNFIKIASMDLNNFPFLKYIASKNKPIILSTGLGDFSEIKKAVEIITSRNNDLILLHCVSMYPPKIDYMNLNNIDMLRDKFRIPVGFSDHYTDETFSLAAVAKGACVIERHFTLDKTMNGWDHAISSDIDGMKNLVQKSEMINRSLGSYERVFYAEEEEKKKIMRRSIVARRDLKKGDIISKEDILFKRPGNGIPPNLLENIVGRKVVNNISKDMLIDYNDVDIK